MVAGDFLRVNRELLQRLGNGDVAGYMSEGIERVESIVRSLLSQFRASIAASGRVGGVLGSAMRKVSPLGLHAFMFHDERLLRRVLEAPYARPHEPALAERLGMPVEDMRECLRYVFETRSLRHVLRMVGEDGGDDIAEGCNAYRRLGLAVPHMGFILKSDPGVEGSPGGVSYTALTPWVLSIIYAMATGSLGAGSVAVVGASVGRGKTTTIYYTLRSVLELLGHPDPGDAASKLILLDPFEFLDVAQGLAERGEKAVVTVVDNASALFPKQWSRIGGLQRFFVSMNAVIDMIRSMSAVTIFVANAPNELASFVRNIATMRVVGEEADVKPYTATIFTWRTVKLRVGQREEELVKREKLASVYVYPLLKLPSNLYRHDLEVKQEVNRRELIKALEAAREALLAQEGKKGSGRG